VTPGALSAVRAGSDPRVTGTFPGAGLPPLRVKTLRALPVRFCIDFGQRNAVFLKRPLTARRLAVWAESFAPVPEPGYDLTHCFNAVPVLTRRPFLVSFESFLPRFPDDHEHSAAGQRALDLLEERLRARLAHERCMACLAFSEYARRQFRHQARSSPHRAAIDAKLHVRYPVMSLRRSEPKAGSGGLKLLFVAHRFMGKGGPALLRAHERLLTAGIPVETTVVSELHWEPDDYIGPGSAALVEREHRRLAGPGVTRVGNIPNARVLELMDETDYFVLPTFHDTFGYVALESLAGATPVIASATCALPEIVEHGSNGYLIDFENDPVVGRWPWIYRRRDPLYDEAYEAQIERMAASLTRILTEAWETRASYRERSAAAIERMRTRFDRTLARDELELLYERCRAA
jgi:glycosyltransferase involved in cell wall biosynthesis